MIRTGTLDTQTADTELVPDPAALVLVHELRATRRRVELVVASLDPRTVPDGVADGLHDSIVALSHAYDVAMASAWGWGSL